MYKRILVPIDGSPTANRGLDEAIRLAKSHRARLCLLHVVDESVLTQSFEAGAAMIDDLLESLRASGRKIVAEAAARGRKQGLKPQTILVENMLGSVAEVIVRQAKKFRAELIVIGTHGRRGVPRVVLGSAAEGVVRTSNVPVLLVRAASRRGR